MENKGAYRNDDGDSCDSSFSGRGDIVSSDTSTNGGISNCSDISTGSDRFLKDIYDSQSEFEAPEPDGLWEGIEASLAEEEKVAASPWRRWIFPVTGAVSAAAAVALFFLLGGLKNNVSTLPASGSIPVSDEAVAVVPSPSTGSSFQSIAAEPSIAAESPTVASSSFAASSDSAPSYKSVPASTVEDVQGSVSAAAVYVHSDTDSAGLSDATSDVVVGVPSNTDSARSSDSASDTLSNVASEDVPVSVSDVVSDTSSVAASGDWDAEYDETVYSQRQRRQGGQHRFSFSANASSVGGMRNSSNGYAALSSSDVTRQVSELGAMGKEYSQVLLSNNNSEVSTLTKHFQPVRFSVTASYRFNRVISIESGLSYTCLVSNLSSGSDRGKYTTRQQLHYIGIPLNVRLDLWSIRNFSMYFSGGGMMEKCVAGKSVTKYEVEGLKDSRASSSLSDRQLQWSVNGACGAQYRFNELVGLYVEPGVSYYFNNGSSIENIYKERPLNFNIAIGLRFNIP